MQFLYVFVVPMMIRNDRYELQETMAMSKKNITYGRVVHSAQVMP